MIITFSRQLGAGATATAREVATQLGYTLVDDALLHESAELAHVPEPALPGADEHSPSFWERLHLNPQVRCYLNALETVMNRYASQGRAVLMGRGGQVLLQKQDALHVRIVDPINERVARVEVRESLTRAQAEQRVHDSDRQRAAFHSFFLNTDWKDPLLYHLILNMGRMAQEEAVGLIVSRLQTPELPHKSAQGEAS